MRRILIDDRVKELAIQYGEKILQQVPGILTRLEALSNELGSETSEILVLRPRKEKRKNKKWRAMMIIAPDAVTVANADKQQKEKQVNSKYIHHAGNEYPRVSLYVRKIADSFVNLCTLLPSQYAVISDEMQRILGDVKVENIWIRIKGKERTPLYEVLVETMGYGKIRSEVMPYFVHLMEIKTCVYCNAQYAQTTLIEEVHPEMRISKRGKPKKGRVVPLMGGYYELDHNKPKSKYPFLCVNFYNLQPCCSACNKRKSDNDLPFSLYYEERDGGKIPLHFAIPPQDVIDFHTKGKCKGIVAHLCDEGSNEEVEADKEGTVAAQFNYYFDIDKRYADLEDEVEELLWRNRIYTKGYIEATSNQFADLQIKGFDFERFILGTYSGKDEVFKRPLTVMKQDIWEQITEV